MDLVLPFQTNHPLTDTGRFYFEDLLEKANTCTATARACCTPKRSRWTIGWPWWVPPTSTCVRFT